jgi:hypothetical protein
MMRFFYRPICFLLTGLILYLPAERNLQAGVKYEQTTLLSGSMIEMMKRMPLVGKKFGGDLQQTSYYTTDSSRTDTFQNGQLSKTEITLLIQEKFISIDHERKTYSELTFAEMKTRMEKALREMKKGKKEESDSDVTMTPKVSVQDTGETKTINGYQTRHYILTMTMEIQDRKSEQKGTMEIVSDLWNTKGIPGFEEQREFYRKMAEKMGTLDFYQSAASTMTGMMQDPNMAKGMAEMKKEMSKIEGTPVLTISSINMPGMPGGSMPPEAGSSASSSSTNDSSSGTPDVGKAVKDAGKESAEESAADAANKNKNVSKVFGKLGGLGGFGGFRKKKKDQPAEETPSPTPEQPAAPPVAQPVPNAGKAEPFMKTTTELKSAERASLGTDIFTTPAGYKPVQEK